ncbi:DUF4880 domain-containing protein [Gluconacetobacter sp. Hr-1-5]|uniref:DUF4880 domain-containing protein n=1 Tax=Gluconacetobacter sp. Hr-1-5 TaxID=3395370 RepID=UPI003B516455
MNEILNIMSDNRTAQANEWVAILDALAVSDAERRRFDAWLQEDMRNLGAYLRAQAIFRSLDYMPDEIAAVAATPAPAEARPGRRRVLAGAAALAACCSGLIATRSTSERILLRRTAREAPGRFFLQGGLITMDSLSMAYFPSHGRLSDIQMVSGRMGVQTASRPVRIRTGALVLHAVDADFDLLADGRNISVVAYQGSIAISRQGASRTIAGPSVFSMVSVPDGESIGGRAGVLATRDIAASRAWRDARIVLDNAPLRDAVAQFARYSETRMLVANQAMSTQRLTGTFNLLRPHYFARTVQMLLRCQLAEPDARTIVLS